MHCVGYCTNTNLYTFFTLSEMLSKHAMILLVNLDTLNSAKFWRNVAENSVSDETWIRVTCTEININLIQRDVGAFKTVNISINDIIYNQWRCRPYDHLKYHELPTKNTVPHPKRLESSATEIHEPQMLHVSLCSNLHVFHLLNNH
jgi:hypothetical protein